MFFSSNALQSFIPLWLGCVGSAWVWADVGVGVLVVGDCDLFLFWRGSRRAISSCFSVESGEILFLISVVK